MRKSDNGVSQKRWINALMRLNDLRRSYVHRRNSKHLIYSILPLIKRVDSGERSRALVEAIMKLKS